MVIHLFFGRLIWPYGFGFMFFMMYELIQKNLDERKKDLPRNIGQGRSIYRHLLAWLCSNHTIYKYTYQTKGDTRYFRHDDVEIITISSTLVFCASCEGGVFDKKVRWDVYFLADFFAFFAAALFFDEDVLWLDWPGFFAAPPLLCLVVMVCVCLRPEKEKN